MCDPKKILCRTREQALDPLYYLDKILSLPKDSAQNIDDLDFDALFEQPLFKSKSETSLDDIVFDQKRFQALIPKNTPQISNPPTSMATIFSPLVLPAQLNDLPQNYNQRIKLFDVEGNVSSQ
jgi:hypothetical protein